MWAWILNLFGLGPKPRVVTCPDCNGKGTLTYTNPPFPPQFVGEHECMMCDGTGQVVREKL